MEDILIQLSGNYGIFIAIMGFIVFGLVYLVRMPIKHFTNKINEEKIRKGVNVVITLIPFGISIGLLFLLAHFVPESFIFSWRESTLIGTSAIAIYNVIGDKRFVNLFKNDQNKITVENITKITNDNKIDNNDKAVVKDAVKELMDTLNKK